MPRLSAPDAGDIIWVNLDPTMGSEQGGYRPALVISHSLYNRRTGLAVCCPMTRRQKGYTFEVVAEQGDPPSIVLADQIRCVDWRARQARRRGKVSAECLGEVREMLAALIELAE